MQKMKLFTSAVAVVLSSCFLPACVAVGSMESLSRAMHKLLELQKHVHGRGLSKSQKNNLYMPEKSALDEMEASLISMAKDRTKQGSNAANLTDFLTQIQDIIDQTMKQSILTRYNTSQSLLDTTWANYTAGCVGVGDAPWSLYTPINTQHVTCRAQEQSAYTSYTDCLNDEAIVQRATEARCATYNSLNTMSRYSPSPCVMQPNTAAPTIGNYLRHMKQYWQTELANLRAARNDCTNVTTTSGPTVNCNALYCTWMAKRYECDDYQRSFENGACQLSRSYTCARHTTCMTAKANAYDEAHSSANASQAGLQAEWRAVMRIECLIDALGAPAAQLQSQIDACIARTHATTQVTFTFYGPTVPVPACDQAQYANMTPGNAAFSTRWYSGVTLTVSASEDGRAIGTPMTCASSVCDCWNGTAPTCTVAVASSGALASGSGSHTIGNLS